MTEKYGALVPNLGRIGAEEFLRLGDKERAEALARQVASGATDSLDTQIWRARMLNSLGKPEQAEQTLREMIARRPKEVGPRLALIYFLSSRKDVKAATEAMDDAIKNVSDIERPEFVWAQCWRVIGDREKADQAYSASLAKWPDDPRVVRGAAEFFEATGRARDAGDLLEKTLAKDPGQRWAARAGPSCSRPATSRPPGGRPGTSSERRPRGATCPRTAWPAPSSWPGARAPRTRKKPSPCSGP